MMSDKQQQKKQSPPAPAKRDKREDETDEEYDLATSALMLLTSRELRVEHHLEDIFKNLSAPQNRSASEMARVWRDEVKQKLAAMSVTVTHKTAPLVQILLDQKVAYEMSRNFVSVRTRELDIATMVSNYRDCFETWIDDSDSVNFKATNTDLLGRLSAKDMYTLTFFSMCTNHRVHNDNILQLGLVGRSSCGKSTLFESVLMEGSHITTQEPGVGRFSTGNKPVLMFHDVSVQALAQSRDTDKIKTIARTEPTAVKVHGTTEDLNPLFIFYSSNERLMGHDFPPSPCSQSWTVSGIRYNHQVVMNGKRALSEDCLLAIQNRFIECFVRKAPPLHRDRLPRSGGFRRLHGVLGMFRRVLSILAAHDADDFVSPVLCQYVLKGLAGNAAVYGAITGTDATPEILTALHRLVHPDLQADILQFL